MAVGSQVGFFVRKNLSAVGKDPSVTERLFSSPTADSH